MHETLYTTKYFREVVTRAESAIQEMNPKPPDLQKLLDMSRHALGMLDHLLHTAVELICTCSTDGCLTFVSDTVEQCVGYTSEEVTGRSLEHFTDPNDVQVLRATLQEVAADGTIRQVHARHIHRNGSEVWLEWTAARLPDGSGLSMYARNITSYKHYERVRQESEQLSKALFDLNPDVVFSLDREGRFVAVNAACAALTGWTQAELVGLPLSKVVWPDQVSLISSAYEKALGGESQNVEVTVSHKDGRPVYLHLTAVPLIVDGTVRGIYGVARDITERKKSEAQLAHLAYHDPLTGLANRTRFMARLDQAMAGITQGQPSLAILYLDLDDFKIVNDSLGHRAGDALLIEAAERLRMCAGPSATVARLGGDEFTVLLEGTEDTDDAIRVALRILRELRAPYVIDGHKVVVTPSVGVVMGNQGQDAKEVLRYADIAM
ncbi:MAG TPA: PAS domain S-box protein, partial [Symbiobacteriaceae bacterium]|nr:PAS domain S-box protein [Symbiobacteriaceae bacterium]